MPDKLERFERELIEREVAKRAGQCTEPETAAR